MNPTRDTRQHPCFNADAGGSCARVHLPVAPRCNIKCNFCNRKYDCANESRPGVSSAVLTPRQALAYMGEVMCEHPETKVAGIAGPGDPFANAAETLETMRLVKGRFPELLLCLASNGLGVPPHLDELAELGVTHMTVTVNAVDPEAGALIYPWIRHGKVVYRGREGAEILLQRQLETLRGLKERGIAVKVNTIVIPGVNDHCVTQVAARLAELDVDLHNCMPLHPNAGTPFEKVIEPSARDMERLRRDAGRYLPQMAHCTRCRADAVGLLGADRSDRWRPRLRECSRTAPVSEPERPHVAVATMEGLLVNLHLGAARSLEIWRESENGFEFVEERAAPPEGGGPERWRRLAESLADCRAVLASAMGEAPRRALEAAGILPLESSGFIETSLRAVYGNESLEGLRPRRGTSELRAGCSGDGCGCG
jgi:nitrogen fixation protein NifB